MLGYLARAIKCSLGDSRDANNGSLRSARIALNGMAPVPKTQMNLFPYTPEKNSSGFGG